MAQNSIYTTDDKPLDFGVLYTAMKNTILRKGRSLFGWDTVTAEANPDHSVGLQANPTTAQVPAAKQHVGQRADVEQAMDVDQQADNVQEHARGMAVAQRMNAMDDEELPTQEENCNINANEQGVSHKRRPSAAKSKKKRVVKKGKTLVARSYGRPKLAVTKEAKKKQSRSSNVRVSKRSKNLKILKKRLDKLKEDVHEICKSLDEEFNDSILDPCEGTSSGTRASLEDKATKGYSAETVAQASWLAKDRKNELAQKRQKYRTQRKTLDLINSYKAGPSHEGLCNNKIHQRLKGHRASKNDGRCIKSKGKSNRTSPRLPFRYGSSDSIDWPSLPTSERTKGLTKETAKEIVKNKQSGSIMKMSRKRWADVVRKPDDNLLVEAKRSYETNKTWASVASFGASASFEQIINSSENKTEIPTRQSDCSEGQIIDQCLFNGEAKGNAKDATLTSKDAETRIVKDRTLQETRQESKKRRDSKLIVGSSKDEHQDCCIDKMSFVETKPVSSVIDLNEGIAKRKKGVNKCNNRTATPYKVRESMKRSAGKISCQKETSDLEICDRLSLMSVNTLSGTSETSLYRVTKAKQRALASPTQKTPRVKKAGTSTGQRDNMKANQDEPDRSKPKKVAVRYRALMQVEGGRLNAKALTEVNSRTRRNESLLVDKEVNRTLQRKQRQNRQQTSHNLQRSPIEKPKVGIALDNKITEQQARASAAQTSTSIIDQPCTSKQYDELMSKQSGITSKQSDGQTSKQIDGLTSKQSDGLTSNQTDGLTSNQTDGLTSNQSDGQTSNQTDGLTSNQTDGPTSKQSDGLTLKHTDGRKSKQRGGLASKQCDGLNKSENRHSTNCTEELFLTALSNPLCATKTIKLGRKAKTFCLEHLMDDEDIVDLGWCHAFLVRRLFEQEDDEMQGSDIRRNK